MQRCNRIDLMRHTRGYVILGLVSFFAQTALPADTETSSDLIQQIVELMSQDPTAKPGHRIVHAKGMVAQGTFQASAAAKSISRAAHFSGDAVPVTVRLSDGTPDPGVADNFPDAAPRGFAIRFMGGRGTDIVSNSHNGFIVGNGEDFLALLKAKAATDPSKPHPWPIEEFLGSHPRALKFVQDPKPMPVSFATESFYANTAFTFVNKNGEKQTGRYQILPVAGSKYLDDAAAKSTAPDFLFDELKTRLAAAPVKFRLLLQLADPGDVTGDSSVVWPDTRKKIELGVITITSLVADNAAAEKSLAFDPARLTDGIELSDDPLPALRSRVYAVAVARRRAAH